MKMLFAFALLGLLAFSATVDAGLFRHRQRAVTRTRVIQRGASACQGGSCAVPARLPPKR